MIYKIPVEWSMYGVMRVEAENITEAIEKAKKESEICALPDGDYIDGSFKLTMDTDLIKTMNDIIQQKTVEHTCDLCKKCGTNNCGNDTESFKCFE